MKLSGSAAMAGLGQPPPEPGAQTTVDLLLAALDGEPAERPRSIGSSGVC
jgi:hypothetical protein